MARILLADDDATTRDLVRRALEADGHSVRVTHDGNDAIEQIKASGPFDLLVTDVEMPLLDGIALAKQAVPLQPGMRILFMSGFADQLDRAKEISGATTGALSKPFTLEQVRERVRKMMG